MSNSLFRQTVSLSKLEKISSSENFDFRGGLMNLVLESRKIFDAMDSDGLLFYKLQHCRFRTWMLTKFRNRSFGLSPYICNSQSSLVDAVYSTIRGSVTEHQTRGKYLKCDNINDCNETFTFFLVCFEDSNVHTCVELIDV